MKHGRIVWITLFAVLLSLALYAREEVRISKTIEYKIKADSRLILNNVAGPISINTWEKNEIRVDYTIVGIGDDKSDAQEDADLIKVDVDKTGNILKVKVRYEKSGFLGIFKTETHGYVIFDAKVPADCNLEIENISGNTKITGIKAEVESTNVSGKTEIYDVNGRLRVGSVSGDVRVLNCSGKMIMSNVSGDTRIAKMTGGNLNAEAVSGNLSIEDSSLTGLSAETVSGDIYFNGNLAKGSEMDFETISGDIYITLPENMGLKYAMKSFSGDIKLLLPDGDRISKSGKVKGVVGNGDVTLQISTLSGDAKIVFK